MVAQTLLCYQLKDISIFWYNMNMLLLQQIPWLTGMEVLRFMRMYSCKYTWDIICISLGKFFWISLKAWRYWELMGHKIWLWSRSKLRRICNNCRIAKAGSDVSTGFRPARNWKWIISVVLWLQIVFSTAEKEAHLFLLHRENFLGQISHRIIIPKSKVIRSWQNNNHIAHQSHIPRTYYTHIMEYWSTELGNHT